MNENQKEFNEKIQNIIDEIIKNSLINQDILFAINGKTTNLENYIVDKSKKEILKNMTNQLNNRLEEYNHNLVIVSYNSFASPLCINRQNRVYYTQNGYPNEEYSPLEPELWINEGGLFHPNCRHFISPYFPGESDDPIDNVKNTKETFGYDKQQKLNSVKRTKEKYYKKMLTSKRLENSSYTQNKKLYDKWKNEEKKLSK